MPITKKESTKIVDLSELLKGMKGEKRKKAKQVAGDIIVQETQKFLDKGSSPVAGGKYKKLMADGKSVSDLFDKGDLRAHLTHEEHRNGVKTGVFSDAPDIERLKASGHNKGDSANRTKREFVPTPKKEYKKSIMNKVARAIDGVRNE